MIKAGVADEGTGSKAYLNVGDECNGNTQLGFELPDGSVLGPECQSRSHDYFRSLQELTGSASLGWLRDVPWGLRAMLNYLYKRYKLPIYMTENVGRSQLVSTIYEANHSPGNRSKGRMGSTSREGYPYVYIFAES